MAFKLIEAAQVVGLTALSLTPRLESDRWWAQVAASRPAGAESADCNSARERYCCATTAERQQPSVGARRARVRPAGGKTGGW
jgi:hypothetical protein